MRQAESDCFSIDYRFEHFELQDGQQVTFQAKPTTRLSKLMKAYCERQAVDINSVVFSYDGHRIREEQTPGEVGPNILGFEVWAL